MAYYLFQTAYTSQAWRTLVEHPQNRFDLVRPAIEGLGGRLVAGYLAFGEYDVVGIIEMPDNVSAAAFSMSVAAGGAVKAFKTTPLMTPEEGMAAMQKAAGAGYAPPS